MAFSDSIGQDLTMTLGGITALHIRLFLTTLESSVLPLDIVHTSFCLFLYLSITSLLILAVPRASGCLGLSQECYAPHPCHVVPDRSYLRLAPQMGLCGAGLEVVSGMVCVPRPCGTGLVSGLFPAWTESK